MGRDGKHISLVISCLDHPEFRLVSEILDFLC